MSKPLTKEEQERLQALTAQKPVEATNQRKQLVRPEVGRFTLAGNSGEFKYTPAGEAPRDAGTTLTVRPIMYTTKYMGGGTKKTKWQPTVETVMLASHTATLPIDNNGGIAGGRKIGAATSGMSEDEYDANKAKSTYYVFLYALYGGDVVSIRLPGGKGMAVKEHMDSLNKLPVSTEIDLTLTPQNSLSVATKKLDIELTSDELAAADLAVEDINYHNFWMVVGFNKAKEARKENGLQSADITDYLTMEYIKENDISYGKLEAKDVPQPTEIEDEIPF